MGQYPEGDSSPPGLAFQMAECKSQICSCPLQSRRARRRRSFSLSSSSTPCLAVTESLEYSGLVPGRLARKTNPVLRHRFGNGPRLPRLVKLHSEARQDPPRILRADYPQDQKSIFNHGARRLAARDRKLEPDRSFCGNFRMRHELSLCGSKLAVGQAAGEDADGLIAVALDAPSDAPAA